MRALVLLHGFTGAPESFDALLRVLPTPGPRVFRPVLFGHRGAEAVDVGAAWPWSFVREVDRLALALTTAGFSGAHLCGYSLGARVALGLIARHGHRFSGATLVSVNPGLASDAERALRVGADERWCELLLHRGTGGFAREWEAQALFASQARLPRVVLDEQRALRERHSASGLARCLRVLGLGVMPDYRGVLALRARSIRLVVGALDTKFVDIARAAERSSPGLRVHVTEGAGHNVPLEAPEDLGRVLLEDAA